MLYLAGQILAYVLVAMVIGAALAWVFLIAPLRRQIRQAQDGQPAERPAGGPPAPYKQRTARETAVPEQAWPGDTPALAATPAPPVASMLELERTAVSAQAPAPADVLAGQDAPVADEPLDADADAGAGAGTGREASAEASGSGDRRLTGAELATTGPIALPVGLGRPGEPVAELVELLRHQRDDSALDKADLSARLAVAEQRAAEAEQRISAAERHASTASARVEEIESALRSRVEGARVEATDGPAGSMDDAAPTDDPMTGPIVLELAREKELLSQQLAEAEGRAAKFSSRLAMARTEAEDAQRQVATMTTRLGRHQAEWAAERLSLLARLAVVEGALDSDAVDPRDAAAAVEAGTQSRPSEFGVLRAAASEYAEIVGTTRAVVSARAAAAEPPAGAQDASEAESATTGFIDAEALVTPPRVSGAVTKARPSAVAGTPARTVAGPATTPRVPAGATGEQAGGGRVVMESSPRWNGLLDPAGAGGDNLKEIVGVGPVIETRLRSLGITTFGQLAQMGDTDVMRLVAALDGFGERIIPDDWIGQAQDLQARHYGGVY